ncbi:MAG: DMT family transporter [Trichlorobacter sp.]|jgi:transporter family-2 protein|nr:DMT family transporter [Trichlorobacter sp.]
MNNILLIILVACGGVAIAVQPSINARLAQKIGSIESSMVSFTVGAIALFLVAMSIGKGNLRNITAAPWWELTGGFCGAFFVTMTIIGVPRIGTAAVMAIALAGQLTTAAMLDQFGLFGMRQISLTPLRGMGIALLFIGAVLVVRK